ncbi:MAG: c-type cytochrome [Burkholderiaceae bacterium]
MKNINVKNVLNACIVIVFLAVSGASMANSALADKKDCFSCHSINEKSIGPAYQEVAARYAGQRDAETYLINRVLQGSRGDWGHRRMPANEHVNKEEARILVEWILSLKNSTASIQPTEDRKE